MTRDDMILVSADDHVIEPRTVFQNHAPKRWAEPARAGDVDIRTGSKAEYKAADEALQGPIG